MDIQRKRELAIQHIDLIARHDEVDLAVRQAALESVAKRIQSELADAQARLDVKVKAALGQASE